ncbi:MAG: glycosyltransferase family 39 protein [Pyrinomonadaceae bacterium]
MQQPQAISNKTIVGLVIVHLAIALPLALSLNIWVDEASSLYTTQNGFLSAFQNAAINEKQAPLYFWILSLWRLVNDSIFFARLLSIICSVAAIVVFARFAGRIFESRVALLASAFFALHPFLILASLEIRGYSMVILVSIILIKLFFDGFANDIENGRRSSQIAFAFMATVALYTHYYLGFLLAGCLAALIVLRKWRAALSYVLFMAMTAIAFLPLVATSARSQFLARANVYLEKISALDSMQILWHHAITFLLPAELLRGDEGSTFAVFRLWVFRLALVALAVLVFKFRDNVRERTKILAVVTIVAFGFFFAVAFLVSPAYVGLRHATPLLVPCVLFVASLCSDVFVEVRESITKSVIFVGGLIVLASFSYSLTTLYPNTTKRGDWARVGAFLEQNESPGQPIIVFTTFDALALPYYYRGVNKILPDDRFFAFDQEAPFGTQGSLSRQTEFVISEIPPDGEQIWLAVNEKCLITEACVPLENFIRANYTIEIEKEFYLEKLFLLKKRR